LRQIELALKRFTFLRDNLGDFHAAIVFYDDASRDQWEAVERAGRQLAIKLFGVALTTPIDYDRALGGVPPEDRKFLFVLASPLFFVDRERQAKFALRSGLTSMFSFRQYVEMGQRAAELAARIAGGAMPGDLPIEQPTKFEFVVNLATAHALGIELPATLLAAADEVIE